MTVMTGAYGNITSTDAPKGVFRPVALVVGADGEVLRLQRLPQFLASSPQLVLFRDESGREIVVDMRIESFDARYCAYLLSCAVQSAPEGVILSLHCGRSHRDDNFRDRFPYVGLRTMLSMRVLHFACCSIWIHPILSQL